METTEYGKTLTRGPWRSVQQVEREHTGHWFDADTLRFFGSRIHRSVIYGGRLFVTSEQPPHGPRRYSVRAAMDDASIETVGEFCGYASREAAHAAAERIATALPEEIDA